MPGFSGTHGNTGKTEKEGKIKDTATYESRWAADKGVYTRPLPLAFIVTAA